MGEIDIGAALLEPAERNTAPALTLAALAAQQDGENPALVVTPADQTVAETCVFLMERGIDNDLYNVGTVTDVTICELAEIVMDVVGFQEKMTFDTSKPDGPLRKLLDVSRMETLGWTHKVDLKAGVQLTYEAFRSLSLQ